MFLKALTLKGFKSFADTTVLELEPGVTVVVGPNGSGKSNVVDAIAWVLGAQAPSAVRSQKMDDVIFAGTSKRPALGRAEVTLTIDNSAGLLPIEFTEVTISRTLFRSGDSDYAINGVGCRLLDVQELLSDAGVGRQQHVIVSQGQIDAVLNARPEERRGIIEEAAGVLKYRRRKERAQRRLDATEASLVRVQDLLREVRRQLRPLERQADAARRHGGVVAELRDLRTFLAGREIASLRSRLVVLAGERSSSRDDEQRLRVALTRLDVDVVTAEAELTARGALDVADEVVQVERLRERARGIGAVLAERMRSTERDRDRLASSGGVAADLDAEMTLLGAQRTEVAVALADLAPTAELLTADEDAVAAERARVRDLLEVGQEANLLGSPEPSWTYPDGRLAMAAGASSPFAGAPSAASAAAEVRGELRSVRATLERSEVELHAHTQRLDELLRRIDALDAAAVRARSECEMSQAVEQPLVEAIGAAEVERLAADIELDAAVAARHEAAEQASRWRARTEALQLALDSARARAGAEKLAGLDGVVGTMLELVEIDEGWEAAAEAALGEALSAVVVRDPRAARAALASLRSSGTAGAVLALGVASTPSAPPAVGAPVRHHVRAHAHGDRTRIDALLDTLLGDAVRVVGIDAAVDAATAHAGATIVTDVGDRFGRTGWRLGVTGGGATAAALEEAATQAGAADQELSDAQERLGSARSRREVARLTEEDLTRRLDSNDARFAAASEALARVQGERREANNGVDGARRRILDITADIHRDRTSVAELEGRLPGLEAGEVAEVAAERARAEARADIEAATSRLSARRTDLEVRAAGLNERQQTLDRRLADIDGRRRAAVHARAEAEARAVEVGRALSALERLAGYVADRQAVVDDRWRELQDQRRRQGEETRAVVARLDGLRHARAAAEVELEELRERGRRLEVDEAQAQMRLEAAIDALRRDLQIEPEQAEAAGVPALPEGVSAAGRARELERELRMLGPVNPLALQEFSDLQERHRFLEDQLEDVRGTRRELSRVIRAVDIEIQSVFAAAFADVSSNFTSLFAMLFPGGVGRLVLTAPDDLLNTGIEVEAKPSGKNVKKLSLLSGGERSLTALAYLFAVFRSRPSPFYVMDEVEAALDDVNLHRFLGLIAEFRHDAQLLIVSHQKRTMEAGDSLLGVTMQPGGSSTVISERQSTPV